jgi:hypothetical protein
MVEEASATSGMISNIHQSFSNSAKQGGNALKRTSHGNSDRELERKKNQIQHILYE